MKVKNVLVAAVLPILGVLGIGAPSAHADPTGDSFVAVVTAGESLESVLAHARATQGAVVDRVVAAQVKKTGAFSIPHIEVNGVTRPLTATRPAAATIPVRGKAIDKKQAWQMDYFTESTQCDQSGCRVTDRLNFTVVFEPANTRTKVTVGYVYAPGTGAYRTPGFDTSVYIDGVQVAVTHVDTMDSNTQTVYVDHADNPLRGQRFFDSIDTYTRLNGVLEAVGSYRTGLGKCSNSATPNCHY